MLLSNNTHIIDTCETCTTEHTGKVVQAIKRGVNETGDVTIIVVFTDNTAFEVASPISDKPVLWQSHDFYMCAAPFYYGSQPHDI